MTDTPQDVTCTCPGFHTGGCLKYKTGDVIVVNNNKYVVLEWIPVANGKYNYALAAEKHFAHPKLFDKDFQHWLAFYMTDNEIINNKGGDPPIGNLLHPD